MQFFDTQETNINGETRSFVKICQHFGELWLSRILSNFIDTSHTRSLDTFKRVSLTFKSWIPDVLNQSSFKPIIIAETFKQLLGPQNHGKFNCYYSVIYIYGEKNVHKSPKTFAKIFVKIWK